MDFIEKKVRDVMIPINNFPTISADARLKDAIPVIAGLLPAGAKNTYSNLNMAVVVDDDNELIGTFGIFELLSTIEPQYLKGTNSGTLNYAGTWSIPIFWEGLFTERCRQVASKRVRDFTTPFSSFVNADDTLIKAAYMMNKSKSEYVPVKDGDRLAGIVLNTEILKVVLELLIGDQIIPLPIQGVSVQNERLENTG